MKKLLLVGLISLLFLFPTVNAASWQQTTTEHINVNLEISPEPEWQTTAEQHINVSLEIANGPEWHQTATQHIVVAFIVSNAPEWHQTDINHINVSFIITEMSGEANFTYSIDNFTVTFTDTSTFGEYWLWDFGDGNIISGRYDEHKNPTHTYTINWSTINESIDYINYTVNHETCNDYISYCDNISKEISFERPEITEDDEPVFTIPTNLIITFFGLLALLTVISLFFDQIKDLFKTKFK